MTTPRTTASGRPPSDGEQSQRRHQLSRIIREIDLPAYTGLRKSQIYLMIAAGEFPPPIKLTDAGHRKGWLETEIIEWQRRRIEARDRAA